MKFLVLCDAVHLDLILWYCAIVSLSVIEEHNIWSHKILKELAIKRI